MRTLAFLFALTLCAALAGCNQPAAPQDGEPDLSGIVSVPPEGPALPTAPEVGQVAMVYIGTKAGGFTDYPIVYDGELTAEKLIQGIADLTGWNLTLAEPVISGKEGMRICLSRESALFTGPPDPQKEEFHMFSTEQLAETILDSIQKTLQKSFVLDPDDPDTLDIWYCMEGNQPLELPDLGLSWPADQPYQWAGVVP